MGNKTPPIFSCPEEALLYTQGGKESLFYCTIDKVTHATGIGITPKDWNPFVETLKQYQAADDLDYKDSCLKEFYNKCQPKNAAEALIGFDYYPEEFLKLAPHLLFLSPWSSLSKQEVTEDTIWWNSKDNAEHGMKQLSYFEDGWAFFGPVSEAKGQLEYRRSVSLYNSIKTDGYNLAHGGVGVTIIKRNDDLRYLLGGGGYHRALAMKAAGFDSLIAGFHRHSIVNVSDVDIWPNVSNGLWTRDQALAYVDHLFEFSSIKWAEKIGLAT